MLLLYLRDFSSNNCRKIGDYSITSHISYSGVTATNTGIESKMCMNGGTINITPVGYRNLFNTKQCSISFWIGANVGGGTPITGQGNMEYPNNRGYSIFLYPNATDLHISCQNDSNAIICEPVISNVVKAGQWNHICVVNNNGNLKAYVNGAKVHEQTIATWTKNWSAHTGTIPLVSCVSGNYIDAFRVYNHALSEEEVLNLYKKPIIWENDAVNYRASYQNLTEYDPGIRLQGTTDWIINKAIPKEYCQVEYITSTGTQYINTGITVPGTTPFTISATLAPTVMDSNERAWVGVEDGFEVFTNSANKAHFWQITKGNTEVTDITVNKFYGINIRGGSANISVTANQLGNSAERASYPSNPITLFSYCDNRYFGSVSIARCSITVNGTTLRSFVACIRKSDGKPGMYDTVTKTFYTNSGSGEFSTGDVIYSLPIEYQRVSYIEATGTQQINTGIYFNPNVDACEVMCQATNASHDGMILANSASPYFWLYHYRSGGNIALYIENTYQEGKQTKPVDTAVHVLQYMSKTIFDDGTNYGTYSQSFTTTAGPLYLCSWGGGYFYQGRIYSCKIWKSGALVRYMVPCYRVSDNVVGMYDIISNTFFTNSGSGSFGKGKIMYDSPCGPMFRYYGGNSYCYVENTANLKVDKLFSLNIWAYMSNWRAWMADMRLISCTEGGGWNIETNGEYIQAAINTGSYSTGYLAHAPSLSPGWHMFTMTFSYLTSQFKGYCDGELKFTVTTPAAYIRYHDSNYIMIGCESTGDLNPGGCYFKGRLGEIRLIAGELTAAEIRSLYNKKPITFTTDKVILANSITPRIANIQFDPHGTLTCSRVITDAVPMRYIKDTLIGGSTANTDNHWNGIRIYGDTGSNLSSSATSKLNGSADSTQGLLRDEYDANNWSKANMYLTSDAYQLIDLGGIKNVHRIDVHHYGEDSRRYYNHKLQYSEDGNTWYTIHDSSIHGTYTERPIAEGVMSFYPNTDKVRLQPAGTIIAKNIIC